MPSQLNQTNPAGQLNQPNPLNQSTLAPHEALEIHELLRSDLVTIKKLQASLDTAEDQQLQNLMNQLLQAKKSAIDEVEQFYYKMTSNHLAEED